MRDQITQQVKNAEVAGVRSYTAQNLGGFLLRKGDKELMSEMISNLKSSEIVE